MNNQYSHNQQNPLEKELQSMTEMQEQANLEGIASEDPSVEELKQSLEQAITERDDLKSQLLRAFADMQNLRKRTQHEKEELRKHAAEHLVRDLLAILDNFERTLAAIENGADVNAVVEGIKLVDRELRNVLHKVHVKRLTALGEAFDPAHHEAIDIVESADHPEGTVIEELKPGYKMADRVIRPALVRVTKKP